MSACLTTELTTDRDGNPVSISPEVGASEELWSVQCEPTQVSGFGKTLDVAWRNYYVIHAARFGRQRRRR